MERGISEGSRDMVKKNAYLGTDLYTPEYNLEIAKPLARLSKNAATYACGVF
jgi:hypothetical protein